MVAAGIKKYVLIDKNAFNFHGSDDCYFEEWFEDLEERRIAAFGFRDHVLGEWREYDADACLNFAGRPEVNNWCTLVLLKLP